MTATIRKVAVGGIVLKMGETRARKTRTRDGDPQPKPVSIASLRRQHEADVAVRDAERTYGVRVTG